ncbi:MAG TPA: DUF6599 family protein [Ignavibacteriaceae bacterium]|nr:DUF6599 family protein [Ignavibacteriaceae bacterium]
MKKLFLFLQLTAAYISAQDFSRFLPDSIEGWKAEGSAAIYTGEELYRLIDGGADIFNEYGFSRVLTRSYFDAEDRSISIEIYGMNDSAAAFGIFSLITFNTGHPIEFKCDAYAGDGYLLFQKGKYYISLSGSESTKAVQNALIKIGLLIEKNIEPAGKPLLVRKFDGLNYSRIAYIKGNLGVYNVTNLIFGKILRVEEGICLRIEGGMVTILKYNSDENAAASFVNLTRILQNQGTNKIIDSVRSSELFKDDESKYCRILQFLKFIIICTASDRNKISEITERIGDLLKR